MHKLGLKHHQDNTTWSRMRFSSHTWGFFALTFQLGHSASKKMDCDPLEWLFVTSDLLCTFSENKNNMSSIFFFLLLNKRNEFFSNITITHVLPELYFFPLFLFVKQYLYFLNHCLHYRCFTSKLCSITLNYSNNYKLGILQPERNDSYICFHL